MDSVNFAKGETVNKKSFLKDNKWQILFLVILTAIFFYKAVLFGNVLMPTDLLVHWYYPWKSVSQEILPGSDRPQNPELSDIAFGIVPAATFTVKSFKNSELPFWNPLRMFGSPQYTDAGYITFTPFNLFYFIPGLSFSRAFTLISLLHVFLLGLFTLMYCEKIGIPKEAALVAATVIMFCFRTIAWLELHVLDIRVWYPLILYLFEDFLSGRKWRNVFFSIILCSLVFLCGGPKHSCYFAQFFFVYIFLRAFFLREDNFKIKAKRFFSIIVYFVISFGLAVAVSAIQIWPQLKAIALSPRYVPNLGMSFSGVAANIFETSSLSHISRFLKYVPQSVIGFVVPKFFGWPADLKFWSPIAYTGSICYVGIVTLLFLVAAAVHVKNYFVKFYLFLSVICILLTIRFPTIISLYESFTPGAYAGRIRLFYIASFGIAVLSGFGINYLMKHRESDRGMLLRRYSRVLFVLFLVCAAAAFFIVIFKDLFYNFLKATKFLGVQTFFEEAAKGNQEVAESAFSIGELSKFEFKNLVFLSAMLFLGFVWLKLARNKFFKNSILGFFASSFIFIDLVFIGISYNPAVPLMAVYPKTETIDFLANDAQLYRVTRFGKNNVLPAGAIGVYGIQDADGRVMSVSFRDAIEFHNMIEDRGDRFAIIFPLQKPSTLDSSLLDLANVKYVLSSSAIPGLQKSLDASSFVYFDLEDNLDGAEITAPPRYVLRDVFSDKGKNKTVIFAHPPSEIKYSLEVPESAELVTSVGVRQDAWHKKSADGVAFSIIIVCDGNVELLFSKYVNPIGNPDDRRWFDVNLDLNRFAGRRVDLILKTQPGPKDNTDCDWAGWGYPRIILRGVNFEETDFMARNPLVWDKEGVFIYKNTDYLPRAFVVNKSKIMADNTDLKKALTDHAFNPRETVLLLAGEEISYGNASGKAHVEEYSNNYVRIKAELDKPGYLVLTDTDYPGWSVMIDGKPGVILRADYIFRAVFLDKGEHIVEFSYVPDGFGAGTKISLIAICVVLVIGVRAFFADRRARKEQ